jgi:hypothetical protein
MVQDEEVKCLNGEGTILIVMLLEKMVLNTICVIIILRWH